MPGREIIGRGAAALLGAGVTLALAAAPATAVTHQVEHAQGGADYGRKASGYWTPARMKRATPVEQTLPAPPTARRAAPTGGAKGSSGFNAARTVAPQLPDRSAKGRTARIHAPGYKAGAVPVGLYGVYPFSTNGKLFFSFRGNDYVCSGTVVASKSRSTVLTAGHCVHDKRLGWARNVVFVPAYWSGYMPFGVWPATVEVAPRGWVRHTHYANDYAALKVMRSPIGPLSRVVGSVGLAWGQPRRQHFYAVGYPNNRYSGQAMYGCVSRTAGKDPFFRGPGQPDTGIGCDMSHGASGGGWTITKRNHGKAHTFLNSVTSYGYNERPNLLFGPYFTKGVRNLVRNTSRR
jgi:hypothetical protein